MSSPQSIEEGHSRKPFSEPKSPSCPPLIDFSCPFAYILNAFSPVTLQKESEAEIS
jgi:hypothetical protein